MQDHKELLTIKQLKSPKGHFLLGHLPQFNVPNKHQVLERWVEECGTLFKINFVGKTFVVSANPAVNEAILKQRPEHFRRFAKITEILEEMGILGVFNAEGDTWQRQRKPTSEALNLRKVRDFYPTLLEKTNRLIEKWNHYGQKQEAFDVQKEFMRYTVDITTNVAFGYELDTINNRTNDFQHHLERIFPMINERITAPIPYWRFIKFKKDRELNKSLKAIEKIVHQFIDDAKQRLENNANLRENPTNFLEALLVEQEKAERFSDHEIYSNVFSILLAGEDTTSNSISWAIFYLAQHNQLVEKVRTEARTIYGKGALPPTNVELGKLVYANAVAQEAIRLKPVTPNLYFQANKDIEIEGIHFPKDTVVMLQNKVAQTDQHYFSRPEEFIPERWLKGKCPVKQHSPDLIRAFGSGPRYCPGKNLAMHEMTLAISAICNHFDLKMAVKPEEVIEQFAFTMYPKNLRIQLQTAS